MAVVDGTEIAKSDYDALIAQAKKSYKNQKRDFPKAGSQEFQTLKNQAVQFLVQREQFEQKAEDLDVKVTDKQVDARLAQIQKQYFGGDKKKYKKQLKEQGLSDKQVRNDIRAQIVSEKIFEKVTGDVKVTDKEIQDYYAKNKAQYSQPESRDVRHILVKTKSAGRLALHAAQGRRRLRRAGEEVLRGHRLEGERRQADDLEGPDRRPVRQDRLPAEEERDLAPGQDQFGYHIIQPLGEIKAAKVTPLKDVKDSIRQQLQQTEEERGDDEVGRGPEEGLQDKVDYAVGFAPPPTATRRRPRPRERVAEWPRRRRSSSCRS